MSTARATRKLSKTTSSPDLLRIAVHHVPAGDAMDSSSPEDEKKGIISSGSQPTTLREMSAATTRAAQGEFKRFLQQSQNDMDTSKDEDLILLERTKQHTKNKVLFVTSLVTMANRTKKPIVMHFEGALLDSIDTCFKIAKSAGLDTETLFSHQCRVPEAKTQALLKDTSVYILLCYGQEPGKIVGPAINRYSKKHGIKNFTVVLSPAPTVHPSQSKEAYEGWAAKVRKAASAVEESGRTIAVKKMEEIAIKNKEDHQESCQLLASHFKDGTEMAKAVQTDAETYLRSQLYKQTEGAAKHSSQSERGFVVSYMEDEAAIKAAFLDAAIRRAFTQVEKARKGGDVESASLDAGRIAGLVTQGFFSTFRSTRFAPTENVKAGRGITLNFTENEED